MRFLSDDLVGGDGFSLQFWCGSAAPPLPRARSKTCLRDNPCARGQCLEIPAYGSDGRGLGCRCPFGYEGPRCEVDGMVAAQLGREEDQKSCLDRLLDVADTVTTACCGPGTVCDGGVPTRCDVDCAVAWMPCVCADPCCLAVLIPIFKLDVHSFRFRKACSGFVDDNYSQFSAFSLECERTLFGPPATS